MFVIWEILYAHPVVVFDCMCNTQKKKILCYFNKKAVRTSHLAQEFGLYTRMV